MRDLADFMQSVHEGTSNLLVFGSKNYVELNQDMVKFMVNSMKQRGIYLTFNKPYSSLIKELEKKGVDHSKIFFIDTVSKGVSKVDESVDNCFFVDSPKALTELSIVFENVMSYFKDATGFVVLDEISALMVYNSTESVAKFVHYLSNKIRIGSLMGFFLGSASQMDDKLVDKWSDFFDNTIHISKQNTAKARARA